MDAFLAKPLERDKLEKFMKKYVKNFQDPDVHFNYAEFWKPWEVIRRW